MIICNISEGALVLGAGILLYLVFALWCEAAERISKWRRRKGHE